MKQTDEWGEVQGGAIAITKQEKGWEIEGFYLGQRKQPSQFGESTIVDLEDEDGNPISLYSVSSLNYLLQNVLKGRYIKIVYDGMEKRDTKYGKNRDIHITKVYQNPKKIYHNNFTEVKENDDLPF